MKRKKLLAFFAALPPCLVGLEACGSAHHGARELIKLGHDARVMPPAYISTARLSAAIKAGSMVRRRLIAAVELGPTDMILLRAQAQAAADSILGDLANWPLAVESGTLTIPG